MRQVVWLALASIALVVSDGPALARRVDPGAARAPAGARGAGRQLELKRALRAGRYEEARRLGSDLARKNPGDGRAAILTARAESALGLYAEARRRLETAVEAAPDDLPLRDALMRLLDATGDRTALAPLIDRCYADWKAGRVEQS